jgi:hypothetical protein
MRNLAQELGGSASEPLLEIRVLVWIARPYKTYWQRW